MGIAIDWELGWLHGSGGADFFLGHDLDQPFAGGTVPVTLEIPVSGSIDVSGGTASLSIMLAASSGGVFEVGQDYFRIIAIDTATSDEFVLDEFLPNVSLNLESTFFAPGSVILDTNFQSLTYNLPAQIAQLAIRIEAFNTGAAKSVGFDALSVDAVIPTPEPGTAALLGAGLLALAYRRRRAS